MGTVRRGEEGPARGPNCQPGIQPVSVGAAADSEPAFCLPHKVRGVNRNSKKTGFGSPGVWMAAQMTNRPSTRNFSLMRFTFRVRFHTEFGQTLWLSGAHEIFGGGDLSRAIPLHYLDEE